MNKIVPSKSLLSNFYWQQSNFQFCVFNLSCDYLIRWSCGFMSGAPSPSITTLSKVGTVYLAKQEILCYKFFKQPHISVQSAGYVYCRKQYAGASLQQWKFSKVIVFMWIWIAENIFVIFAMVLDISLTEYLQSMQIWNV